MRFNKPTLILLFAPFLTASVGYSTVIINDQFDDGALGTNTNGVGGGFVDTGTQITVTESGGVADFTGGGTSVQQMQSIAAFNPFQSTATTLTVSFASLGFDSGFDRQWVGYRAAGVGGFFIPNPGFSPPQGLYLSFAYNNAGEDGKYGQTVAHRGNLVVVSNSNSNTLTTLASWDWTAQPGAGFAAALTTTDSTYSLDFTGATVSSFITGSSSGALVGLGMISTDFNASVYHQVSNGVNGSTVDSLTVVAGAIPEPSTYAAIFGGVALIGAAVYRRRRSA